MKWEGEAELDGDVQVVAATGEYPAVIPRT